MSDPSITIKVTLSHESSGWSASAISGLFAPNEDEVCLAMNHLSDFKRGNLSTLAEHDATVALGEIDRLHTLVADAERNRGLGSASALEVEAGEFYLVSDPEHSGPREDWYCGCPILKSPLTDLCPTCRVAAPWLTWARSSVSATKPEASPSPENACVCAETSTRNCPVHGQGDGAAIRPRAEDSELRQFFEEEAGFDNGASGSSEGSAGDGRGQAPPSGSTVEGCPEGNDGRTVTSTSTTDSTTCWCCGYPVVSRDPDPWEGRMDGYCLCCSMTRCDTTDSTCMHERITDEEEGHGFEDGGLQSRPSGGDS